jgi:hypothetical protein
MEEDKNLEQNLDSSNEKLHISGVIKSLTLEDITQIVSAFSDMNITTKKVQEYIELNFL